MKSDEIAIANGIDMEAANERLKTMRSSGVIGNIDGQFNVNSPLGQTPAPANDTVTAKPPRKRRSDADKPRPDRRKDAPKVQSAGGLTRSERVEIARLIKLRDDAIADQQAAGEKCEAACALLDAYLDSLTQQ